MQTVSGWDRLLSTFSWAFTQPTAATFRRLITGWVLATSRRTISGVIPFADPGGERSHDSYHRFVSHAAWAAADLWQTLAEAIDRYLEPGKQLTVLGDDTVYKKTGKQVDGAGYYRDQVRSTTLVPSIVWGLNLVVLTVRIPHPSGGEPLALPINMRLFRKGETSPQELLMEMILELTAWLPERTITLVADGFYASLAKEELAGARLITRLRKDAAIFELPARRRRGARGRPARKGKRLPPPREMARRVRRWRRVTIDQRGTPTEREVYSRRVIWWSGGGARPVQLVLSRHPDHPAHVDYYLTTDQTAAPEEIVEHYVNRWPIEDTFRWVKQHLGGEQPQAWRPGAPERAAAIGLLTYSLVWLWFLPRRGKTLRFTTSPWYPAKQRASFKDALAALRSCLWRDRNKRMSETVSGRRLILALMLKALAVAA